MVCFVVICICFSVERLAFTHIVFWLKPCFSPIIVIVPFWITKWCFSLSSWNSWLMGWLSKLETWGWNQLYRQTLKWKCLYLTYLVLCEWTVVSYLAQIGPICLGQVWKSWSDVCYSPKKFEQQINLWEIDPKSTPLTIVSFLWKSYVVFFIVPFKISHLRKDYIEAMFSTWFTIQSFVWYCGNNFFEILLLNFY